MSTDPLQVAPPLAEALSANKQAIWFRIGALWEQMKEPSRALSAYEAVLRHNSSHVAAMIRVGEMHQREHIPASITYLSTAVQLEPNNGSAWASLAYAYVMGGDFDKAYHAYYQAFAHLSDRGDPMLWHGIGLLHDRLGNAEDALAAFNAALELKPPFEKMDEVYYAIGIIYKEKSDYNNAHAYLSKVISINSSPSALAEAYYQIGIIHELAGNTAGAVEAYEIALQQQNHLRTMQSFAWLKHKTGKSAEAVELLRRATQLEDTDGTTAYLLGRIYMANNEYRVAYDSYQQAVHLDGKNANYWCSIAALYYQRQQHRDAMDAFRRAINIDGSIPEIWFDLGALYEMYNQNIDAVNSYRLAVDLRPQNARFTERLSMLQRAMSSGFTPQPPIGKPASEEIHPLPFTIRRSSYKSEAPTRYGSLPPPPDINLCRQSAANQQQIPENARAPATIPTSGQAQRGANLSTPPPVETSFAASAPQHAPNNDVAHSGNHVTTAGGSGPKENDGRHLQGNVNGALRQGEDYRGNISGASPAGPDHSTNAGIGTPYPSPPARVGVRENSQGPVSPLAPGVQTQALDGSAQANGSQHLQSPPASAPYKQSQNAQDGRAWHDMSGRMSTEPRVKQDLYTSQAGPKHDSTVEVDMAGKAAPSQSGMHPALPNKSYQGEHRGPVGQPRNLHALPAPNAIARSPTTRSHLSSGRESGQQQVQYLEMSQSRAVEASSAHPGRRMDASGDLASCVGPKPSVSEEPSRRSVSSSFERTGRERSGPMEVERDAGNAWPSAGVSKDMGTGTAHDMNASGVRSFAHLESRDVPAVSHAVQQVPTTGRDTAIPKGPFQKDGAQVDEEMLPKLPPLPGTNNDQHIQRRGEATHSSSVQQDPKHSALAESDKGHVPNGPNTTQGLQPSSSAHMYPIPVGAQDGIASKPEPMLGQNGSPTFRDQRLAQAAGENMNKPGTVATGSPNGQKGHLPAEPLNKSPGAQNAASVGFGTHGKGADEPDRQGQIVSQKRSPVRPRSPTPRPDSRYDHALRGFGTSGGMGSRHSSNPAETTHGASRPSGLQSANDAHTRAPAGHVASFQDAPNVEEHKTMAGIPGENRRDASSDYNAARESSLKNAFGSRLAPPLSRPIPRSVPAPHAGVSRSQGIPHGDSATPTANSEGVRASSAIGVERNQIWRGADAEQSGLGKRSASFYENGSMKARESEYGRVEPKSAVISPSIQKQEAPRDGAHSMSYSDGMQYRQLQDGRTYGDNHRELKRGRPHAVGEAYVANRFSNGSV